MKYLAMAVALGIGGFGISSIAPTPATAGGIQKACMSADRSAASRNLCGCIEDVAGAMLSRSEQSRVVKFFKDPHKSQVLRQSDRRTDEKFWQKYKQFGQAVNTYCG
ncbi:hypothetical protein SAMN04488527_11370 [Aliiroseovarius crassostreae]|uniref:Arginine transporter n=2 Tax=Aliiroseovarius crassostreae TaxID=154981 RepID=A0A0N8IBP5_9RHOB|nr:hypothetical protein [Aliiroseovarius crassostreae]KPN63683.1 hypothetical protein AKJ29_13770 [Aliiroseovarius crassostreae]SFU73989.1 hypothetical protein SAMN04488527_11370 [Aliiroseovarius crassostreae]